MQPDDKVASCIKEKGNWGKLQSNIRFDHKDFDAKAVKTVMHSGSPKLEQLIANIRELDEKDMSEHRKLFKHFIYSDIKSAYGAKLIASGLAAAGFEHAYALKKTARGMSFTLNKTLLNSNKSNTFATLTSVIFFEKPIGINFRKELLRDFNSRPENSHGERIRIIILDSGFREGVDLFDVKYVHLFEPIATASDQKQAIGRATRYCGQKGLRFDSKKGWPLQVYRYETILTPIMQKYLLSKNINFAPADTFFNLFMKYSNIDPKKINFANELEKVAIGTAVDQTLTKAIHEFKIPTSQNGGSFKSFQTEIDRKYGKYTWPPLKVENGCVEKKNSEEYYSAKSSLDKSTTGGAVILPFTPTQDFVFITLLQNIRIQGCYYGIV